MAQAGQEAAQPWGSSFALPGQHQAAAEGFVGSAITLGASSPGTKPWLCSGFNPPLSWGLWLLVPFFERLLERAGRDGPAVPHSLCRGAGTVQKHCWGQCAAACETSSSPLLPSCMGAAGKRATLSSWDSGISPELREAELGPIEPTEKWSLLQNSPFASTIPPGVCRDEGDQTPSSFEDSSQLHIN